MRKILFILFALSFNFSEANFKAGSSFLYKLEGDIGKIPMKYDAYDIDIDTIKANKSFVSKMHAAKKNIICYFSAGSWEKWRVPNPYEGISQKSIGKFMGGWDEFWIDITQADVRRAQEKIMDQAVAAGCDAIEPDNTDHYQNDTGFKISKTQNIDYLKWFVQTANSKGLKVGLKNTQELIAAGDLHKLFSFTINEQCFTYQECDPLKQFAKENKAVFIIEYKRTHESKPYPMVNFKNDCDYAKQNKFFFFVYRTQAVNGDVVSQCN